MSTTPKTCGTSWPVAVASTQSPITRFNLDGHYDGSQKPCNMKTPGVMFIEDSDPADFDAQFFSINHTDASSMDPQQRFLMEVAYECLESAGIPVESLAGTRTGCLVGASAVGELRFEPYSKEYTKSVAMADQMQCQRLPGHSVSRPRGPY